MWLISSKRIVIMNFFWMISFSLLCFCLDLLTIGKNMRSEMDSFALILFISKLMINWFLLIWQKPVIFFWIESFCQFNIITRSPCLIFFISSFLTLLINRSSIWPLMMCIQMFINVIKLPFSFMTEWITSQESRWRIRF